MTVYGSGSLYKHTCSAIKLFNNLSSIESLILTDCIHIVTSFRQGYY